MDLLKRLDLLSERRRDSTAALHKAIGLLLGKLDRVTTVGDSARANGLTLRKVSRRTNIGSCILWELIHGDVVAYPELDIGQEKYLHGDFHAFAAGPSRADLIALAGASRALVADLVRRREEENEAMVRATAEAEAAAAEIAP